MPLSIKDIENQAAVFYKKASIESDMAKRIMVSIIPALRGKGEYGGFDPVALRSAAAGAKELVKYGAEACYEELKYLPDQQVNYDKAQKLLDEANRYRRQGDSHNLLQTCKDGFLMEGWSSAYGGKAWARIADTLIQIDDKYQEINSPEVKRDPELSMEKMKEIIVLMNVFDGLAHNTGNVMPKVLDNERKGKNISYEEDPEYSSRVLRMMDAKELDDPFTVYKEIEHVINETPYRLIFKDWISKIRQHPDYRRYEGQEAISRRITLIKSRKELMRNIVKLEDRMDKFGKGYRRLLAVKVPSGVSEMGLGEVVRQHPLQAAKKQALKDFYKSENGLTSVLDYLKEAVENVEYNYGQMDPNNVPMATRAIKGLISDARGEINQFYNLYSRWHYSDDYNMDRVPDFINDEVAGRFFNNVRQIVGKIVSLSHSL
jgi:hypothetical protein